MKTNLTTDMTTAFPYNHAKRRYSNTAPRVTIAYAYYRLSQEEANEGQSSSILNQEKIGFYNKCWGQAMSLAP